MAEEPYNKTLFEGFSVIARTSAQTGPREPRVLVGTLRLINHSCNANCEVSTTSD